MGEIDVRIRMAVEEDRKKIAEWLMGNDHYPCNAPYCRECDVIAVLREGNALWEEA